MLWLYDAATSETRVLLDPSSSSDATIDLASALWSPAGDTMLLAGDRSLWLLDVTSGLLRPLGPDGGPRTGLMFLPDGEHVSYVEGNDLYVVSIADGRLERLTSDGSDLVINGGLDWVYNEELATRAAQPAYAWSPDGQAPDLAAHRRRSGPGAPRDRLPARPALDQLHPLPGHRDRQPAGVAPCRIARRGEATQTVSLPADAEYILPFFAWTPDGQEVLYATVSRDHHVLRLSAWDPSRGTARTVLVETDPAWINEDRYSAPVFVDDEEHFLWLSERDGFMHLYLYDGQGTMLRQLTQGEWMIDSAAWNLIVPGRPVQVDRDGTWAWFIATRDGPLERQLYRVNLASGELERLSREPGWHGLALSPDGRYLVDQYSDVATPPVTQVLDGDGSERQRHRACRRARRWRCPRCPASS